MQKDSQNSKVSLRRSRNPSTDSNYLASNYSSPSEISPSISFHFPQESKIIPRHTNANTYSLLSFPNALPIIYEPENRSKATQLGSPKEHRTTRPQQQEVFRREIVRNNPQQNTNHQPYSQNNHMQQKSFQTQIISGNSGNATHKIHPSPADTYQLRRLNTFKTETDYTHPPQQGKIIARIPPNQNSRLEYKGGYAQKDHRERQIERKPDQHFVREENRWSKGGEHRTNTGNQQVFQEPKITYIQTPRSNKSKEPKIEARMEIRYQPRLYEPVQPLNFIQQLKTMNPTSLSRTGLDCRKQSVIETNSRIEFHQSLKTETVSRDFSTEFLDLPDNPLFLPINMIKASSDTEYSHPDRNHSRMRSQFLRPTANATDLISINTEGGSHMTLPPLDPGDSQNQHLSYNGEEGFSKVSLRSGDSKKRISSKCSLNLCLKYEDLVVKSLKSNFSPQNRESQSKVGKYLCGTFRSGSSGCACQPKCYWVQKWLKQSQRGPTEPQTPSQSIKSTNLTNATSKDTSMKSLYSTRVLGNSLSVKTYPKTSSLVLLTRIEQTRAQIEKDIPRTSSLPHFKPNLEQELRELLTAYCVKDDPQTGYVQGMNLIGLVAIFHAHNVYQATQVLQLLMMRYNLRSIYLNNMEQCTAQAEFTIQKLKECVFDMHHHIVTTHKIDLMMFIRSWYPSLLASFIPLESMHFIFDKFVRRQFLGLTEIIITLFLYLKTQIMATNDEQEIMLILTNQQLGEAAKIIDWEEIVQRSDSLNIKF